MSNTANTYFFLGFRSHSFCLFLEVTLCPFRAWDEGEAWDEEEEEWQEGEEGVEHEEAKGWEAVTEEEAEHGVETMAMSETVFCGWAASVR